MINDTNVKEAVELVVRDKIILTLLYLSIMVFGLIANISIVIVILLKKQLRKRQQYILLNLIICDCFTICVSTPYYIYAVNAVTPKNDETVRMLCKSYIFFIYSLGFISIFSMLFISLDRYSAIVYPYFYRRHMTGRKIIVFSALCWLLPSLSCIIATIMPEWIGFDGRAGGFCGVQWSKVHSGYVCFQFGLLFLLPTVLIFFTNIRVYTIAKKQKNFLPGSETTHRRDIQIEACRSSSMTTETTDEPGLSSTLSRIRRRLSSVTLVGSVTSRDIQIVSATLLLILCYLFSWLPFVIPRFLRTFKVNVPELITTYTPAFAFSNVVWDPFLILWCRNEIRKCVYDIYRKIKKLFRKKNIVADVSLEGHSKDKGYET